MTASGFAWLTCRLPVFFASRLAKQHRANAGENPEILGRLRVTSYNYALSATHQQTADQIARKPRFRFKIKPPWRGAKTV